MRRAFIFLLCLSFLSFTGCSLVNYFFDFFVFRGDGDLPEDDLLSEVIIVVEGFQFRVPEGWSVVQNDEEKTFLSVPDENNEVELSILVFPLNSMMSEELPDAYFTNLAGIEFQMELLLGPSNSVTFKYQENYYGVGFTIRSDEPIPELEQGEVWNPSVSMGYDRLKLIVEQMYKYMEPVQ